MHRFQICQANCVLAYMPYRTQCSPAPSALAKRTLQIAPDMGGLLVCQGEARSSNRGKWTHSGNEASSLRRPEAADADGALAQVIDATAEPPARTSLQPAAPSPLPTRPALAGTAGSALEPHQDTTRDLEHSSLVSTRGNVSETGLVDTSSIPATAEDAAGLVRSQPFLVYLLKSMY